MKKEEPKVIKPSEIILKDKIKQRQRIRKEILTRQKEKYKNKGTKHKLKGHKKEIINQLKEVYISES